VEPVVGEVDGTQRGKVGDGGGDRRRDVEREDGQVGDAPPRGGVEGDARQPRSSRRRWSSSRRGRGVARCRLHGASKGALSDLSQRAPSERAADARRRTARSTVAVAST